jgi:PadR family transcriptional regulator PadR
MIVENTQTQMRKGILEYCILSIIAKGETYASDIIAELKKAQLLVVEGTLYPLLTRLKNNGLLTYNWVESTSGPPRKYYVLADEGRVVLEQLDKTWKELEFAVHIAIGDRIPPATEQPTAE